MSNHNILMQKNGMALKYVPIVLYYLALLCTTLNKNSGIQLVNAENTWPSVQTADFFPPTKMWNLLYSMKPLIILS